MRDNPIYVVVGTVYENNDEQTLINQEFIECETYEQADQQESAFRTQLNLTYPNKKITTYIQQI